MPHEGKLRRTRQQATWTRQATALRARVEELNVALDALATERWRKGTLEHAEYERQAARFLSERAEANAQADELDRLIASSQPLDVDVLSLWPELPLEAKQRAMRLLIAGIQVKPTPRMGRGQKALVPKRLEIGWLG
jgi:hypothetical protein